MSLWTRSSGLPLHRGAAATTSTTTGTISAHTRRFAVLADPGDAVPVVSVQDICGHDCARDLGVKRIGDRRCEAVRYRHGEERTIDAVAIGQTEADVRGAACRVDSEFVPQPSKNMEYLSAGIAHGAYGHDERIDDDVGSRDPMIRRSIDDLAGNLEPDIRIFGDSCLVVRDRDNCRPRVWRPAEAPAPSARPHP